MALTLALVCLEISMREARHGDESSDGLARFPLAEVRAVLKLRRDERLPSSNQNVQVLSGRW